MPEQTQLECVSCETAFDPSPNGGFCPNCDTPHPEYDAPDADGDASDDSEPVNEITDGGGNVITDTDDDGGETDADVTDAADDSDDATAAEDADDESAETDDDDAPAETDDDDAPAETDADEDEPAETDEAADEDDAGTIECQSCESTVDASASFCPNCGEEIPDEADEDDESVELEACPDCGNSVDDESYCPNCGTDLDAIRESGGVDADADAEDADADTSDETDVEADDDADADDADDTADVPQEVTLEIDGEPYTFEDGDVFGRRDEEWLADLVSASGGREEARYLSSEHLEFAIEDDGVYVTDVSTNGTKLNGTPMDGSEEQLEDGDTLELADRAEIDVSL